MAITRVGINDAQAVKAWSKKLNYEASKALDIEPLMGEGSNSIIQVKNELRKEGGDCVTFSLRAQIMGRGVSEGETLKGNEEALQFLHDKLYINELNHAVSTKNKGTIDQQRILFSLRDEAHKSLVDWYADRLSLMFFTQVCGYTAPTMKFEGREIELDELYYGFNAPLAPSSRRIVRPEAKTKDEDVKDLSKHSFSLKLIDEAVKVAKLANPKIRPVRVGGSNVYVMYLHPIQVMQLRTNTDTGQWLDIQKAAYSGSRAKNPIFDGSLGMYNGVILRESEHVTHGVKSDGTVEENVRRAVLLGAQSAMLAFGAENQDTRYKLVEELDDYQRVYGVAAKTIIGMKKTRFQMPGREQHAQDFGTVVVSTCTGEKPS